MPILNMKYSKGVVVSLKRFLFDWTHESQYPQGHSHSNTRTNTDPEIQSSPFQETDQCRLRPRNAEHFQKLLQCCKFVSTGLDIEECHIKFPSA